MSTGQDYVDEGLSISPREESPASNHLTSSENSSDQYQDSGVVLSGHSSNFRGHPLVTHSRARSRGPPATAPAPGPIGISNGAYPSPSAELRRSSIVEMMNSGGLVINRRGSCEINLSKSECCVLAIKRERLHKFWYHYIQ